MSKSRQQVLAQRKQQLIQKIEQQRIDLSVSSRDWLHATAPYDRAWQTVIALKPLFIAATGLISIYTIKHPRRIFSLGKKAVAAWSLARTLQSVLAKQAK